MRTLFLSALVLCATLAAPALARDGEPVPINLTATPKGTGTLHRVSGTFPATASQSFVLSLDTVQAARLWRDQGFRFGLAGDTANSRKMTCKMRFKPSDEGGTIEVESEVQFFSFMGKNKDKGEPDVPVTLGEQAKGKVPATLLISKPGNWMLQYSAPLRSFRIVLSIDGTKHYNSGWRRLYQEEMNFSKFFFAPQGFKTGKAAGATFEVTGSNSFKFTHKKQSILSVKNLDLRLTDAF